MTVTTAAFIEEWYAENRQQGAGQQHCLITDAKRASLVAAIGTFVAEALEEAARCAALELTADELTGTRIAAAIRTLARERTGSAGGGE